MRASEKTARRDARTAGKTAQAARAATGKGACATGATMKHPRWRNVATRNGEVYLLSPDGKRKYYGTPQEVLGVVMSPTRRKALADSLRITRATVTNADERRNDAAALRREAIMYAAADLAGTRAYVDMTEGEYVILEAGARLVGYDMGEYVADLIRSEITAFLDEAQAETGKREIPLTYHERVFLSAHFPALLAKVTGGGNGRQY